MRNSFQGLESVHLGHLDIQNDNIGIDLGNFFQGDPAIGSNTRDFDPRVARENVRHQPANHHGIIDYENANFFHFCFTLLNFALSQDPFEPLPSRRDLSLGAIARFRSIGPCSA